MLIDDANKPENKEYLAHYYAWYNEEWKRQGTIIGQLEHHAITYLMTTNGGQRGCSYSLCWLIGFYALFNRYCPCVFLERSDLLRIINRRWPPLHAECSERPE